MRVLGRAMQWLSFRVCAFRLLSLGAPQPLVVTGLAEARLSPWLKWGDWGQNHLVLSLASVFSRTS